MSRLCKGGNNVGKWWKVLLIMAVLTTVMLAASINDVNWIWYPDPPGTKGEARFFRTVLEVDEIPESALARIIAGQLTTVYLNGEELGYIRADEILGSYELADYLKKGKNILAIKVEAEPNLEIQPLFIKIIDLNDEVLWATDSSWKAAPQEITGWLELDFDDKNWAQVLCSKDKNKPEFSPMELVALMGQFAPKDNPDILKNATIWATHSAEYVFSDDKPGDKSQTIKALTGRNQYASAQLAIRSAEDIVALELDFSDLKLKDGEAIISKGQFDYNFIDTWLMNKNSTETPVNEMIRQAPAEMPDILAENRVSNVPKDFTKTAYLKFFMPKGTQAGVYKGQIILKTIGASREVPVEIEVLPLDLPDETNLKVTIWFQPDYIVQYNNVTKYSEEFWNIIDYYAKVMAEHRQNMVWTPLGMVDLSYNEQGELIGEFSKFDQWVETFFRHGFKYIELSHIGGRTGDWSSNFGYWQRSAYDPSLKTAKVVPLVDYVHLIQEHLRTKGWLEGAYLHVADEPTPANYQSWLTLAKEIKKGAPDLKLMEAVHYTHLTEELDVIIPQLDYFDQNKARLRKEQEEGKTELWFYTCWLPQGSYPNRLLDYPLYKTRILHWANFIYDAGGYLHWGYNWWRAFEVGYAPGDGWIVYPTEMNFVPALRYEAMREGIEDYEYFLLHVAKYKKLAAELGAPINGDERAKEIALSVMPSLTRYTKDPLEMLSAREKLLREIVDLERDPKALVITDISEDKLQREEFTTKVEIYTEKDAEVYLNGAKLTESQEGYYTKDVLVTPDSRYITVKVIKGEETKIIERVYNNWRINR